MREQSLFTTIATLVVLFMAVMQHVLAQESLMDSAINQNEHWSFSFNREDKVTGVLTCTAGALDLLIWLDDSTAMHRQRAWEGFSVPFSWVIPSTGTWNVEVFDAQNSTCTGWIKLDVERTKGGFGFAIDPTSRTVLLGIIAVCAVAIVCVVGYALFQKRKGRESPRRRERAQNNHSLAPSCAHV